MLCNVEFERDKCGLKKNELATLLGVSLKTYYNWINEETSIPSSSLIKMSEIFKVDVDYLLNGSIEQRKRCIKQKY